MQQAGVFFALSNAVKNVEVTQHVDHKYIPVHDMGLGPRLGLNQLMIWVDSRSTTALTMIAHVVGRIIPQRDLHSQHDDSGKSRRL